MKLGYLPRRAEAAPSQRASKGVRLPTWRLGRSKAKQEPEPDPISSTTNSGLTSLPVEIQFMIISQLGLVDMVALRQTSRLYRSVITADVVERYFTKNGYYDAILLGCCTGCLSMPGLDYLILDATREHHLWRSICFRCWRNNLDKGYQRKHGSILELASGKEGYICHFCAWPVSRGPPDSAVELLHAPCRVKRLFATVIWFVMAIIQVGLGVLALVLAWTIYKRSPTVIYPTSIDFGLSVVALVMFMVRTCTVDEQTYAYALAAELMMTIVRIPPVCFTARETFRTQGTQWSPMAKFALGIFLMNLILRFVDTIGYALLYFGYDPRSIFLAGLSLRKKILYNTCTVIVWCAFIPN